MESVPMSGWDNGDLDPYTYTSGRWLRDDDARRRARYNTFDFQRLIHRVLELCPGATSISHCEKKEGGHNRVFLFTTNDKRRLVARIPYPLTGPPRQTTQSEVATIHYLQKRTSIPVPKILDWSTNSSTPIGVEYIIMEYAEGVQLHRRWGSMNAVEKITCIRSIYEKIENITSIDFPAFGSLYFSSTSLEDHATIPLDDDFCIGPHCGGMYWNCDPTAPRMCDLDKVAPNRGPWHSISDYGNALIDSGIARISSSVSTPKLPRHHGSPSDHVSLLGYGRSVLHKLSQDPRIIEAALPMLIHPDLHMRNIFVKEDDPTVITAIIDWQSAAVEPAFWDADVVPDFARSVPNNEGQLNEEDEMCNKVFSASVQFRIPKLRFPMSLEESLFRPYRYCFRTWKDGVVPFRQELIEISQRWKKDGLPGSCPYPLPNAEDLAVHGEELRKFAAAQQLLQDMSNFLNVESDGWMPSEDWEATLIEHKKMYSGLLEMVVADENPDDDEPIKNEADLRELWPFDLDLLE